jgi:hypothetical protein
MIYIIHKQDFHIINIMDYLKSLTIPITTHILEPDLDYQKIITNHPQDTFIFCNELPTTLFSPIYKNIYVLNLEQLSIESNHFRVMNLPEHIKIIDYSLANIKCVNRPLTYIPHQVNETEMFNYPKIYDVVTIGTKSENRYNIVNEITKKNVIVNRIVKYGVERDELLFRHKILVNIHFNKDYQIFEELRCNRCIINKVIVISEKSINNDNYELKKYMIECKQHEMADMVKDVLENYDFYYNKLFKNFDSEIIEIANKYKLNKLNFLMKL